MTLISLLLTLEEDVSFNWKHKFMNKTLKFEVNDQIQSIDIVENMFNKNTATKPNTYQKNWTKKEKEEGMVLTHTY